MNCQVNRVRENQQQRGKREEENIMWEKDTTMNKQ